jgi:DNA-binding HxlR family transcriptional regulator
VEYELTDKGRDLLPIIEAMTEFGQSWPANDTRLTAGTR